MAHEPAARVALEADLEGWGGCDRLNWKSMALETVSICKSRLWLKLGLRCSAALKVRTRLVQNRRPIHLGWWRLMHGLGLSWSESIHVSK